MPLHSNIFSSLAARATGSLSASLLMLSLAMAVSSIPLKAATLYAVSGTFTDGGTLGGTVTIDTTTGAVTAANITATIMETLNFSTNVGAIPDFPISGYTTIAADSVSPDAYPLILLAEHVSSFVGYNGGPIKQQSNIEYSDGRPTMFINSGNLTFFAATQVLGDPVSIFNVGGSVAGGGPLSGTVTIDTLTGAALAANITAIVPKTLTFSTNVGAILNYPAPGYTVIAADSVSPDSYPLILLAENVPSFVGYTGGPIVPGSNIEFSDGTPNLNLVSGSLTALPEPSSLYLASGAFLAMLGLRLHRRRKA